MIKFACKDHDVFPRIPWIRDKCYNVQYGSASHPPKLTGLSGTHGTGRWISSQTCLWWDCNLTIKNTHWDWAGRHSHSFRLPPSPLRQFGASPVCKHSSESQYSLVLRLEEHGGVCLVASGYSSLTSCALVALHKFWLAGPYNRAKGSLLEGSQNQQRIRVDYNAESSAKVQVRLFPNESSWGLPRICNWKLVQPGERFICYIITSCADELRVWHTDICQCFSR